MNNKKVEVLREFSGLKEGDILYFNNDSNLYEYKKVEEDISDYSHTIKKIDLTFSSKDIKNNPHLFKVIEDNQEKKEFIPKSKEEIETKIEELLQLIYKYELRNYNPFNWIATEVDKAKYQIQILNWALGKLDE
jgi:hypothetical protein